MADLLNHYLLQGGKWTVTMKQANIHLLDRLWTYLVLGLVGEEVDLHDDVCGAIIATRPRGNRLQVWVREKDNVERVNGLGKRLIQLLEITEETGVSVEFSVGFSFFLPGGLYHVLLWSELQLAFALPPLISRTVGLTMDLQSLSASRVMPHLRDLRSGPIWLHTPLAIHPGSVLRACSPPVP